MVITKKKIIVIVSILFLLFAVGTVTVTAQTPTSSPTPDISGSPTPSDNSQQIQSLNNEIHNLQNKITDLQGQEKTLSTQISVYDSQIKLTELRITATQQEITDLTLDIDTAQKKIANLENSINDLTKAMLSRIVATYEIGSSQPIQILASSNNIDDYFKRANYLRIAQEHDKQLAYDTVQAKVDYANQKNIFEQKKKQIEGLKVQLEAYTKQQSSEKDAKQKLLADTQGNEANYQKLLAQAKAQLEGFSRFANSHGGSGLLGNQTVCDDWGCYYNQRDSQWGGIGLNGTQYTIASDGCLMTSMAMVITHYGHKVTPVDINSNPSNFASYYPAYLLYTISAGGVSAKRTSAAIDATLNNGSHDPVIVGISYDGGPVPDHFIVLISGSGGNYIMNDPYVPNGHAVSFNAHYSVGSIREVDKVSIL